MKQGGRVVRVYDGGVRAPRSLLVLCVVACACVGGRPAPTPVPTPTPAPAPIPTPAPTRPAAPTPAEFFPLAVGNTWTYLDRSPSQATGSHHTVRIVKRDADGYFVDDQQGALRADDDCLHDRSRRLLCKPIQTGTSWSSVISPTVTERYRIVGTGEKVTVAAGTFTGCLRVRSQARLEGAEQIAELTYAPGVGLIRIETFSVVDGAATPQVRGELESYRLATASK